MILLMKVFLLYLIIIYNNDYIPNLTNFEIYKI